MGLTAKFLSLLSTSILAGCTSPMSWGDIATLPLPWTDIRETVAHQEQVIQPRLLERPLSVDDAVKLAVEHNLDARVKAMEGELASGKAELARFAMMPNISLDAAATMRSSASAYTSNTASGGNSGSNYSTSEDKNNATADLTLSWNLVDLGLAVLRSGEEDDRVILANERRRRAIHLLVQDVRTAYWKAVVNETAERRYQSLEQRLDASVSAARKAETDRIGDPLQLLTHQRAIIETMRQIGELQRQTSTARSELAGLMGSPSVTAFQLVPLTEETPLDVSAPPEDLDSLEREALLDRPETRSDEIQFRIDVDEVRAEMLRTLPGVGPFLGGHYDSTSYLLQNIWADAGIHLITSLNDLITAPTRTRNARNTSEVTRARGMVTAMAVITQVHVADDLYRHAYRNYRLTEQLADVDERISRLSGDARKTGYGSEMEEIRALASSILSGLRKVELYAELEAARARMDAALGRNPWGETKAGTPTAESTEEKLLTKS
jgi:outer membrane protein TolC